MRLTIKTRLSLRFGLVVGLVIIVLGTYLYFEVRAQILSAVDLGLRARAAQIQGTITRSTGGVIEPNSQYFEKDQSFIQVYSSSLHPVEVSSNVEGEPMLPLSTITSVAHSAFFTRRAAAADGNPLRILVARYGRRGPGGFVLVGENLKSTNRALEQLFMHYLIACAGALAAILATVWLSIRSTLRPVETMRKEARSISSVEPFGRLPEPDGDDELTRLARTLNEMLERLRSASERERRFIMFASHELRTPLTVLRTELDLALDRPRTAEELRAAIVSAGEETDRLARLSDSLIALAASERHPSSATFTVQNVSVIVAAVCDPLEEKAQSLGVKIAVSAEDAWTACDQIQIRQAITNMVDNALRYSPAGSVVSVVVRRRAAVVQITAEDSGPGFPEDFLPRAFVPFARVGDSEGTGLGLAIVSAVAQAHGGRATAINLSSGGARVTLELPTASAPVVGQPGT